MNLDALSTHFLLTYDLVVPAYFSAHQIGGVCLRTQRFEQRTNLALQQSKSNGSICAASQDGREPVREGEEGASLKRLGCFCGRNGALAK